MSYWKQDNTNHGDISTLLSNLIIYKRAQILYTHENRKMT